MERGRKEALPVGKSLQCPSIEQPIASGIRRTSVAHAITDSYDIGIILRTYSDKKTNADMAVLRKPHTNSIVQNYASNFL
jgi:hypothetical protein